MSTNYGRAKFSSCPLYATTQILSFVYIQSCHFFSRKEIIDCKENGIFYLLVLPFKNYMAFEDWIWLRDILKDIEPTHVARSIKINDIQEV